MSARLIGASGCAVLASFSALAASQDTPPPSAWAAACEDWDEWEKPGPPFAVAGNTYYVGTCGIAAILVTSDEGHVLIDSGTQAGAEIVADNIARLGFEMEDVELILTSHEHFDHVGGIAKLQAMSGARIATSREAGEVIASGKPGEADPQAGSLESFPAARVDRFVTGGDTVDLGPLRFTAIATPGHTPGALSWAWTDRAPRDDEAAPLRIVYADSLSPVSSKGYRFSDHPDYVAAYRAGLSRLGEEACDLVLTPHPTASGMRANIVAIEVLQPRESACRDYAASIEQRLDARLAKEAGAMQ